MEEFNYTYQLLSGFYVDIFAMSEINTMEQAIAALHVKHWRSIEPYLQGGIPN
jgi:hypothetical protein